jgi:hypothetical protein
MVWILLAWSLHGCAVLRGAPAGSGSEIVHGPLKQLTMDMTEEEVHRLLPDTACRNRTVYHGNPAEVWGYKVDESKPVWIPEEAPCESSNFWIYFENGRLVGWTPVP